MELVCLMDIFVSADESPRLEPRRGGEESMKRAKMRPDVEQKRRLSPRWRCSWETLVVKLGNFFSSFHLPGWLAGWDCTQSLQCVRDLHEMTAAARLCSQRDLQRPSTGQLIYSAQFFFFLGTIRAPRLPKSQPMHDKQARPRVFSYISRSRRQTGQDRTGRRWTDRGRRGREALVSCF